MAVQFDQGIYGVEGLAGEILVGATLTFSVTGTSTPLATYSEPTLTTANANPVVADSYGRFGPIWLQNADYKVILKTAAGVTLVTRDPVKGGAEVTTSVTTIAAMKALAKASLVNNQTIEVGGYTTIGDGGGGTFYWVSASTATTNLGTIFASNEGGAGRWLRKVEGPYLFEWFGAAGDAVAATGAGTDDTAAVQATIDFANAAGTRAIEMSAKNFLVGNITMGSNTVIIGTGRQSSLFVAKAGTTGKWFTDTGSASKIMLSGIAWYARSLTGITHILELGNNATQFGTEGILYGLWLRDAPEGYGLYVDGNVGLIDTITAQSCKFPVRVEGAGNHLENIVVMQSGQGAGAPTAAIGLDLRSFTFARGVHVEAPADGSLPIRLRGDCHIKDVLFSNAASTTFSHLIEIDTASYNNWSIGGIQFLPDPNTVTISNGVLKVGSVYRLGTNPLLAAGGYYSSDAVLPSGPAMRPQAFMIRVTNTGGTIQHRIGHHGNSSIAGTFHAKINNASQTLTNTPTGADGSTAFATGAKISSANASILILDVANQTAADQIAAARIIANTTTASYVVWPLFTSRDVNGTTRVRLELQLLNPTTAAGVDWATALGVGQLLDVQVEGYLA